MVLINQRVFISDSIVETLRRLFFMENANIFIFALLSTTFPFNSFFLHLQVSSSNSVGDNTR